MILLLRPIQEPNQSIPFDLSSSDLSLDQKQILHAFLQKHSTVFGTDLKELGKCSLQPHRIETGDAYPIRQRFYSQSPQVNAETNRQLRFIPMKSQPSSYNLRNRTNSNDRHLNEQQQLKTSQEEDEEEEDDDSSIV